MLKSKETYLGDVLLDAAEHVIVPAWVVKEACVALPHRVDHHAPSAHVTRSLYLASSMDLLCVVVQAACSAHPLNHLTTSPDLHT